MGLDYSIRTYVKKDKLSQCLNWLYTNSWVHDSLPLKVAFNNEILKINGDSFKLHRDQNQYLDKNNLINDFEKIFFSTSLIFDIDPKIIASIPEWTLDYRIDLVEEFKKDFEQLYLGNGKIRIGGFDSTITKLNQHDVYEIDLTAVTSDMSKMLETSISVKKWILEFSKISDSILTYLDLEHNGRRLLFYNGMEIEATLKEGFDQDSFKSIRNLLKDYHELEYDTNVIE